MARELIAIGYILIPTNISHLPSRSMVMMMIFAIAVSNRSVFIRAAGFRLFSPKLRPNFLEDQS